MDRPLLPCNYSMQLLNDSARMHATGTVSDGAAGMSAMQLVSRGATALKASKYLLFQIRANSRVLKCGCFCTQHL